jgi:hypothetical protein
MKDMTVPWQLQPPLGFLNEAFKYFTTRDRYVANYPAFGFSSSSGQITLPQQTCGKSKYKMK